MKNNNSDIESIIYKLQKRSAPTDRYTSFDFCYNYFKNKDLNRDIEKSCLALGFYLSSWGMMRGSSFLLRKSAKNFQPLIEYIATLDKSVWNIDIDSYSDKNIDIILDIYKNVKERLINNGERDLVLITKILLGVFGFIPAYDRYFCDTFRDIFKEEKCGFRVVNKTSLSYLKDFYEKNKKTIDDLSNKIYTTDFVTGEKTLTNYSKAKIVDMYGFGTGLKI